MKQQFITAFLAAYLAPWAEKARQTGGVFSAAEHVRYGLAYAEQAWAEVERRRKVKQPR